MDPENWSVYKRVLTKARERGISFAVGGGLATMVYSAQPRKSKDLDLFVLPADREELIRIVAESGLEDYYGRQPYDRAWIYRASTNGAILDIIWRMANQRAEVDPVWIEGGPQATVDGIQFRLVPPEETLWAKLYIMQRDRCDWPDALNLLYTLGDEMDWERLLRRTEPDTPLLSGLLSAFKWICPDRARDLPAWLWCQLDLRPPAFAACPDLIRNRANYLDTRPWFTPALERNQEEQC